MPGMHWSIRGLAGILVVLVSGCSSTTEPARISIAKLDDAFRDIEKGNATWAGKRVIVSGGSIKRVWPDHVDVIGDKGGLICYYEKPNGSVVAKALRGQPVTISGQVRRLVWGENMRIKLEACEFVFGSPPATEGEAILASRGAEVDAERDIKAGHLRLRYTIGLGAGPPPWFPEYQRQLKERCGVETVVEGGPGPVFFVADDREYNEVMIPEIEKRFGVGIVKSLRKQAESGAKK